MQLPPVVVKLPNVYNGLLTNLAKPHEILVAFRKSRAILL